MAGTRLLIQIIFLGEFVLLLGIAGYFGLCRTNDIVCAPLMKQGGRSLLILPNQWQERVYELPSQIQKERDLQQARPMQRYSLHVTLVLEDGSEWSSWAKELDDVLTKNIPCLSKEATTEISLAESLSKRARQVDVNNATEYHLAEGSVKDWLSRSVNNDNRRNQHDESLLHVFFFVPSTERTPLLLTWNNQKSQPSTALTFDDRYLVTIVNHDSQRPHKTAMADAMSFVDLFLQSKCQISSDTTMWWQQLVHDTHQRAKTQIVDTRQILLTSSLKVPITQEVSQRWQQSLELVNSGLQQAQLGNYALALDTLEESLTLSQSLMQDPTLMEPLDFGTDHYLAIFAPLIFPLLLPFVAGAIREFKRYKKLQSKTST